jgi:hypothetical protein
MCTRDEERPQLRSLAAWLRPEDVEPALRLLALFESYGRINPREGEEWRRRILA